MIRAGFRRFGGGSECGQQGAGVLLGSHRRNFPLSSQGAGPSAPIRTLIAGAGALVAGPACAADGLGALFEQGIASLPAVFPALLAGLGFALYFIERKRAAAAVGERDSAIGAMAAKIARTEPLIASETQAWIVWDHQGAEPRLEGDASFILDAPSARRLLGLTNWLPPEAAASLGALVGGLLERGQGFQRTVETTRSAHFEIDGRAIGASAVLRIRDATVLRRQLGEASSERAALAAAHARLLALFDALPHPVWMRDARGALVWVSQSYAQAVEAKSPQDAIERQLELLDAPNRAAALLAGAEHGAWRDRVIAVSAGDRRTFDAVEVTQAGGSAAFAGDQTPIVALRAEMERYAEANARMLDQLTTGVAIFDRSKRLVSHNAAYRRIWALEPAFLEQGPQDGQILDQLRSRRLLPEQADFKNWKVQALSAYRALEASEQTWHLPDGRTLRVVAGPNSQGGVTYLYDDATQSYALASQVNALTNVQGETLEALKEGVAVFGMDGRLRLVNRTFCSLWRLDPELAQDRPHIEELVRHGAPMEAGTRVWAEMRDQIVGLPEARLAYSARVTCVDGTILDCGAIPLPDGGTLLTFLDSTAGAKVERALLDRNEALVSAERIRNDFVNHVSYELRTPLTSIIGFTQLLAEGGAGPLNPRQLEYAGVITKSSDALLAIINDILDLASVDAGALELRLEDVDVGDAMRAAAEGVQDRLLEQRIDLRIVATDDVGAFRADGRRVRQVLFNLLSNAVGFSNSGQVVTLTALRRADELVFKVSDQGRGIPPEVLDKVFERFQTHSGGTRHRGVGLGLSIVRALVELHGGRVVIDSVPAIGTTVTCFFPAAPAESAAAAAAA